MLYVTALRVAGTLIRDAVYSELPAVQAIDQGVIPDHGEPLASLRRKDSARERVSDLRADYDGFLPVAASVVADPFYFPKRSENPLHKNVKTPGKRAIAGGEEESPSKRTAGEESIKIQMQPGGQAAAWLWIAPLKSLMFMSGVYQVDKIAAHFKVAPRSRCWPWLLSMKELRNKPQVCSLWGKPGHKTEDDVAHKAIVGFDVEAIRAEPEFYRAASTEEKARLKAQLEAAGL